MGQSVTLLNDPAVEPRMPKVAGLSVDYPTVAGDLEPGMLDLSGTIDRLDEKGKLAEVTMLARLEAIDELKTTVVSAGRSAEGLFYRAGDRPAAEDQGQPGCGTLGIVWMRARKTWLTASVEVKILAMSGSSTTIRPCSAGLAAKRFGRD